MSKKSDDVVCDHLKVASEAVINRLYVEEIDIKGGALQVSNADPHSTSLVARGDSKLKGLKAGAGIKLNPYEKSVEIKCHVTNRPGLHERLVDVSNQTVRQIKAGPGVKLRAERDYLEISGVDLETHSSGGATLLSEGKLKTVEVEGGEVDDSTDKLTIKIPTLTEGRGINLSKRGDGNYTVSCRQNVKNIPGDGVTVFNEARGFVKRVICSGHLTAHETDTTVELSVKDEVRHVTSKTANEISLLQNGNFRTLLFDENFIIHNMAETVKISQKRRHFSQEFVKNTRWDGASVQISPEGIVDVLVNPPPQVTNAGHGIPLFRSPGKCKSIIASDGVEIEDTGESLVIKNTKRTTNSGEGEPLVTKFQTIKGISANDGITISPGPSAVEIGFPVETAGSGWSIWKGRNFCKSLKAKHPLRITDTGDELELSSETYRRASGDGICVLQGGAFVNIKGVGGTKVQINNETIEINTPCLSSVSKGSALLDGSDLKGVKCIGKYLSATQTESDIILECNYKLNSLGSGHVLHDGDSTLKTITVGEGLEVFETCNNLHVSAGQLLKRNAEMQNQILQLSAKLDDINAKINDKLGFIEWFKVASNSE